MVPMDILSLNWGDKSPPSVQARKTYDLKMQKLVEQFHVFAYFERIQRHKMDRTISPIDNHDIYKSEGRPNHVNTSADR